MYISADSLVDSVLAVAQRGQKNWVTYIYIVFSNVQYLQEHREFMYSVLI